jgi:hypothetical protein
MIRKLKSGEYRLYSRKKDPKTGKGTEPRDLRHAGGGREAREGRAILQAPLDGGDSSAGSTRGTPPHGT